MPKQTLPAFIRYSNVIMGCKVSRLANIDFDIRLEIFSLRPRLILTLVAQAGRTFSSYRRKVVRANGNVDGHMVNALSI